MGATGGDTGDLADIDFDDLTSPRLTDVQCQILKFTEARHVEFDIDRMLAEAVEQAGVSDLDDGDGFRRPAQRARRRNRRRRGPDPARVGRPCGNVWFGCCETGCR